MDGSVAYRVNTPELSAEEKAAMFALQNLNVEILINPFDADKVELMTIHTEIDQKTPSQRLRGVLYVLWEKRPEGHKIFDTYYMVKMNGFIEHLKGKIDE